VRTFDLRSTELAVNGQEVLSRDGVAGAASFATRRSGTSRPSDSLSTEPEPEA
jgi:hypothetical protein